MLKLLLAAALILSFSRSVCAEPIDSDPVIHSSYGRELIQRGIYVEGLEHLRKAYLIFPLNEVLKRNLAEGYAAYGLYFFKLKRFEQADENYLKAMELYPEAVTYGLLRGICNYNLKKYDVARYELEQARAKDPQSAEILYYLGLVQYETENRQQAMELWEQALKLQPGRKELLDILAKSRKETSVEGRMDRGHSSRFDLTYDPGVDTGFALAILDVLESAANQIGAELGYFPEARVPVAIYKRDDFKTVTDSPDWSGGFYDGKIRLPFGSLTEITPVMRGVLYHEYTHVIIFELTRGNCPTWLNEGIAEMFGRMQYNRPMAEFGRAARKNGFADFRKLEGSFGGMGTAEASLAYQQSYALVNYMVTTFGWHRIKQILIALGNGTDLSVAISTSLADYNLTYDQLITDWQKSVAKEMGEAK